MYIISNQKDYYDGVVGSMGIDKQLIYNRKVNVIDDNESMIKEFQTPQRWDDRNNFIDLKRMNLKDDNKYRSFTHFILGFCGKLYIGWKFHYTVSSGFFDEEKTDIIYGYENVKHLFNEYVWGAKPHDIIKYIESYDPINMFRELGSPVFVLDVNRDSTLTVNPILKDYKFYQRFDSFSAFQEVSMFIGGVLGIENKEIVEVADKYKIEQHGFDKWSFRKEKSNGKTNK